MRQVDPRILRRYLQPGFFQVAIAAVFMVEMQVCAQVQPVAPRVKLARRELHHQPPICCVAVVQLDGRDVSAIDEYAEQRGRCIQAAHMAERQVDGCLAGDFPIVGDVNGIVKVVQTDAAYTPFAEAQVSKALPGSRLNQGQGAYWRGRPHIGGKAGVR